MRLSNKILRLIVASGWVFYLNTHSTRNRQTFEPAMGFKPAISAFERPLGSALADGIT
jgi:hypothetical protein